MKISAGVSSSALMRWMNTAASQPSTTRWSKLEERFIILRGMNWLPSQTGRTIILLTPTIATSGWLMTGVVATPPIAPSEVMVMVEPDSSSRVALPVCAASASRLTSAAQSQRSRASACLHHRHDQARRRLRGDADMDAAVAVDDAGLVVEQRVQRRAARRSP